jgi:hypothetical protein
VARNARVKSAVLMFVKFFAAKKNRGNEIKPRMRNGNFTTMGWVPKILV